MNSFIKSLRSFDGIIDMLKSYFLDMIIFSNLSNKILVNETR